MPTQTITSPLPGLASGTWRIDPARSAIAFRAATFKVGRVRGRFAHVEGTIEVPGDGGAPTATGRIALAGLSTGNPRRDEHLASADFFDAARHPYIEFAAASPGAVELTIKGVTRTVAVTVEVADPARAATGTLELRVRGRLDRRDFGVATRGVRELGGVITGRTIDLALQIVATREP